MPEDVIASWTTSELTRFVQKQIDAGISRQFTTVEAEQVIVSSKLTIKDQVEFQGLNERLVGGTGNPVFAGSWTASANKPRFFRDPHSVVHLAGAAIGGVSGTVIFTLPPGYRPNYQCLYAIRDGLAAHGTVIVNTDGTVVHESGNVTLISLDAVFFKARTT